MAVDLVRKTSTEVLRALADPVRERIVELLADEQLCVCHLTEELDLAQPLVSHHLKILREAGLVEGERWRYWTYYRLRPDALRALAAQLESLGAGACDAADTSARRPCC
jgi:ArsR family transcriptional regulator, arsenate/arsenite/antimonite-responsive transcriptional repressor